jgi:ectoine hydroxylase-related dioxygenase (phytanoyl-CoA dioxygenase family)
MPLVDVRKESALAFVPGSHRWGKKFRQQDFGELNPDNEKNVNNVIFNSEWEIIPDIDKERDKYNVTSWDMKAGDCVAFNARIIHGGGGNLLPDKDLKVFNTQWLGEDVRVCFKESGMDPDHSKKMKEAGKASGDKLGNDLYPVFCTENI